MKIEIEALAGACVCGREHPIAVKKAVVERGALQSLPALLSECGLADRRPAVICDENTYRAAGQAVCRLLPQSACIRLSPEGLHADEKGVQAVLERLPQEADLLLAVGAGTIHDLTRYVAHQKGLPFVSVPTAASVDGFVSTVAAMTWHGFKKTFPAVSPLLVVADSAVFAKAPARLTASGVSDLLGKYTALADWKISSLVTGEYECPRVRALEFEALRTVTGCLKQIRAGQEEACEQLMQGLLLSGLAMQMVGNSRPASGAEHHISHLWEMEVINPHVEAYHGEKVGVGLLMSASVYHRALALLRAGQDSFADYGGVEAGLLREKVRDGAVLEQMLQENEPDPLASVSEQVLRERKEEIIQALEEVPGPAELRAMLKEAGCVVSLQDRGLPEGLEELTLRLSPYVRNRLTFMRLLKRYNFGNAFYHS